MPVRIRALLVHHEEGPIAELKFVLKGQGEEIMSRESRMLGGILLVALRKVRV